MCLLLVFASCENKELYPCPPDEGIACLQVIIDWEGKPQSTLPDYMRIFWYPQLYGSGPLVADMPRYGGFDRLPADQYLPLCIDYSNTGLEFRNQNTRQGFEIYNVPAKGLYNTCVPQLPGEVTVAESNRTYLFYLDSRPQTVETENIPQGDTVKVYFYPQNVLREFTFLIYGVSGAGNMSRAPGGAISGMSASYFPAEGKLAEKPSTILFSRLEAIRNAQNSSRWTDEQKALFAQKNSNWQSADTLRGWTGDWVTGKFSTFGPVNANSRFRLTVEALSNGSRYYYGAWGYWYGTWEETVGSQIRGALEGNGKGTPQERQEWWRQHNGGFDIILNNAGRLQVPDDGNSGGGGGSGFIVDSSDWDDVHVPVY